MPPNPKFLVILELWSKVVYGWVETCGVSLLNLDNGRFLGRAAIEIAGIPENLNRLLFEPHPAEAQEQRFDGQAGLDLADAAHFPGDGEEEGYLLLVRYLPKPASGQSIRKITALVELHRPGPAKNRPRPELEFGTGSKLLCLRSPRRLPDCRGTP